MSIRPIDMQTLLPKLQAMKFAKELEINKQNNDMTDLNREIKDESVKNQSKILKADQKDTDKLKNDYSNKEESKKGNSKNKKKLSKKEDDKKEEKDKKIITDKGNRFDMKV